MIIIKYYYSTKRTLQKQSVLPEIGRMITSNGQSKLRTQIFSDLFLHFYLVSHYSLNIAHSSQPTNTLGNFFSYILRSCAMRIIVTLSFRAPSVVSQKLYNKTVAFLFCSVKIPSRETWTSSISVQHHGLSGP